MERVDSDEEEEEEVVIHLTSGNPQVNKGNHEYKSEVMMDFAGVGESSSQMGLGHQLLRSSLFSKWVNRLISE